VIKRQYLSLLQRASTEMKFKGKSVSDILEMRFDEAAELFSAIPRIFDKLKTIAEVGLGNIKMGQPATQLSGGKAQRIKLAATESSTHRLGFEGRRTRRNDRRRRHARRARREQGIVYRRLSQRRTGRRTRSRPTRRSWKRSKPRTLRRSKGS
jgi:hypothetical protein